MSGLNAINVRGSSGFASPSSVASAGRPAESTCAFGATSIAGSGQGLVTVSTTAPHITQLLDQRPYYLARWLSGGGLALAGFFVLAFPPRAPRNFPLPLIPIALRGMIPPFGAGGASPPHPDPRPPGRTYNGH